MRWLAILCACAVLPSCASVNWISNSSNEPIADAEFAALEPGTADLGACLGRLGAPNLVWEYRGNGLAMAYGWLDGGGWGFSVSYSFDRFAPSARFSYDSDAVEGDGVVMWFDENLVLERVQRGRLRDLVPDRRRPAPLEVFEQ